MRRDINLQGLSKEHHHVLLFSWKLRKGLENNAGRDILIDYIKYFVENVLNPHCSVEETAVFSWLPDDNELKTRALLEHEILEKMVKALELCREAPDEKISQIADFLDSHVRFEERVLFPYLQQVLNYRQLNYIGDNVKASHKPVTDDYPYNFGENA